MTGSRTVALLIAGTLVLAGTGCGTATPGAPAAPSDGSDAPRSIPTTPTTPGRVPPARRAPSTVVAQPPVLAVLPGGRRVRVRAVGTTPVGLLDVPDDIEVAGWWRGGARLGDPFGSILVAAHVDSRTQGLGPFAELLTAGAGAHIRMESAGLHQEFVIRSRRLVPQGSLGDDSWIFDATGAARLTLVTCAPPYDSARGGYQNLAVVTAVPLGPPEAA